jgi:6-phosphogluconolactonase (cycloisomerase 2 family)
MCIPLKFVFASLLLFQFAFEHEMGAWDRSPSYVLRNPSPKQSLVNSVDFHPNRNLCCATFTHNQRIDIYRVDEESGLTLQQSLHNPDARLNCPQHAVFSKDGSVLIVANWPDETFNLYLSKEDGLLREMPHAVIQYPQILKDFRPHGITFSHDGNYLAVAFGASKNDPQGIALFRTSDLEREDAQMILVDLLQNERIARGIPKGIAFSPDNSCLLVTFATTNSIAVYEMNWTQERITGVPKQVLEGSETGLARPEDIKFTIDGSCCAVSNSAEDVISFYAYDAISNCFPGRKPQFVLDNPSAGLSFPHGLAFSADGLYLAVTQFGPVIFDHNDDLVSWGVERGESIAIFKCQ